MAKEHAAKPAQPAPFNEMSWESIVEPGAYVDRGTGDLFRFTSDAVAGGDSPIIRKESLRSTRLVHLSKNPFITTVEARMLAAGCNVSPNF
jgi:hypothetical protein